MEKIYTIFVPEQSIDEDELQYSEIIAWCFSNLSHTNVLILSMEDIYLLQYESEALDIINAENKSMLQDGEDDWIISNKTKRRVHEKLTKYLDDTKGLRVMEIVKSIIELLEVAIRNDKNIYFNF